MFIRGREREADIRRRFAAPVEGFVLGTRDDLFEARIVANGSWAIDLFLALTERLSPRVRVAVEDWRSGLKWSNPATLLTSARDAVVRLRPALMNHAGVEIAFYDESDQIVLTPHLEVVLYSKTERWYYLLRDFGLKEYATIANRSWRLERNEFPEAPELERTLGLLVKELALELA